MFPSKLTNTNLYIVSAHGNHGTWITISAKELTENWKDTAQKTTLEPEMSKCGAVDYIGSSSQNCCLPFPAPCGTEMLRNNDFSHVSLPKLDVSSHRGARQNQTRRSTWDKIKNCSNRASAWVISAPSSSKTFVPASGT